MKCRHRDTLEIEALEIDCTNGASLVNPLIPLARISKIGAETLSAAAACLA